MSHLISMPCHRRLLARRREASNVAAHLRHGVADAGAGAVKGLIQVLICEQFTHHRTVQPEGWQPGFAMFVPHHLSLLSLCLFTLLHSLLVTAGSMRKRRCEITAS